jgi:uncharacterized membrane protein HdeD (DUF308 family)
MLYALMRNWWAVALRGAAAIVLGVAIAVTSDGVTPLTVALVAAHAAVDGVLALVVAFLNPSRHEARGLLVAEGLVSLAFAVMAATTRATLLLPLVAGARATALGILQLLGAADLHHELVGEWRLGLAGVVSLGFGVAILTGLGASTPTTAWLIAAQVITSGVLLVALALRLRRVQARMTRALSEAA